MWVASLTMTVYDDYANLDTKFCKATFTMPDQSKRSYEPSRLTVNAGVLFGGAIGVGATLWQQLDGVNAFLLTGFCATVSVAVFSYVEVFVFRTRQ